jgi:tetratricopeptide (TPR) repeat protein
MVAAILILVWRTEVRLPVFQNNVTLWEDALQSCQTSAPCHAGLGWSLIEDHQVERGVRELIRAVEIRPLPLYLSMLGDAYTVHVGDYRQAIIAYRMAMNGEHSWVKKETLLAQIARAHLLAGNLDEAGRSIQASREINPDNPFLLVVDAFYQWKRGNWQQARRSLLRALSISNQSYAIGNFLSVYWGNAADAGRLLGDLRPQPSEIAAQ